MWKKDGFFFGANKRWFLKAENGHFSFIQHANLKANPFPEAIFKKKKKKHPNDEKITTQTCRNVKLEAIDHTANRNAMNSQSKYTVNEYICLFSTHKTETEEAKKNPQDAR